MKKVPNWQVTLALILVALSVVFYLLHYLIFRDVHHIFIYLIGDIAFLFIDVMIVTLVLNRLLVYREKQAIFKKINVVIDAFYSEVGIDLIKICLRFNSDLEQFKKKLKITTNWIDRDFSIAKQNVQHFGVMDSKKDDLVEVKSFLMNKRQFLLSLLGNPNLVEHEAFTNLLLAILHLTDELENRQHLDRLSEPDYKHLSEDMRRVFNQLILQWLEYIRHLKRDYPYLFSLAIRINPFDETSSVEINNS
jgi:hypothetical protein